MTRSKLLLSIAGAALAFTTSGCGRISGPEASAPPAVVDQALVRTAIERLRTPQPVTIKLVSAGSVETEVGLIDSVMIDPESTITWVFTDHSALAAALADELPDAAEVEAASDAEETMLPAFAAMGGASTAPLAYVIDGDTMWLPVDAIAEYQRAQFGMILMMSSDEAERAAAENLDAALVGLPNPDDWRGRWISVPYQPDARVVFPPGLGGMLDIGLMEQLLAEAGLIDGDFVDDEFRGGPVVEGLTVTEVGRTAELVKVEVSAPGTGDSIVLAIDGEGTIRQIEIEDRAQRFEFTWSVDAEVMVVPSPSTELTKDEIATWLNLEPSCVTDQMSIVDSTFSVDPGCVVSSD